MIPENTILEELTKDCTEEQYNDVLRMFTDSLTVKSGTKRSYRNYLSKFLRYLRDKDLKMHLLKEADMQGYTEYLKESKLDPDTVSVYTSAVRKFYKWTEKEGIYPDIAGNLSTAKEPEECGKKSHLTDIETLELLSCTAGRDEVNGLRNYAIVKLIIQTGIKTGELCRLNVADFTKRGGVNVLKVWGKTNRDRDCEEILSKDAASAIQKYLDSRGEGVPPYSPLFVTKGLALRQSGQRMSERSVQGIVKKHLRRIGLDGVRYSTHALRRNAAMKVVERGGGAQDIQRALRMKSGKTGEKYFREIVSTEKKLQKHQ